MDNHHNNPIVPERDDSLGRGSSGSQPELYKTLETSKSPSNLSSAWKLIALLALFGMLAVSWFGWQQYQQFSLLQERFHILDSRLNNTDESVNQSGVAMQVNIGNHSEQLKKHWSEIRKLWGVANDKNKGKISKNSKDISFLVTKRNELEATVKQLNEQVDKDRAAALGVGENFFGLSADLDNLSQSVDEYFAEVENLKNTLKQQDKQIESNLEAVKSMDAFRRQTNLKILELEKKVQAQSVESSLKTQNIDSNSLSPE